MIVSLVATTWLIMPGQTLSGIASDTGTSVSELADANQIPDVNLIFAGATLTIPGSETDAVTGPPSQGAPQTPVSPVYASPVYIPTGGSFQSCVISRESGGDPQAVNPVSGAGGLYGFLPSTFQSLGYSGLPENAPVWEQNQAFEREYMLNGVSPWQPSDGC